MKITKREYCEALMSKLSEGKLIPRFLCVENTYTEFGDNAKNAYLILNNIKGVIEVDLKKSKYSIAAVKRVIDLIAIDTDKYIKLNDNGILDPNDLAEVLYYWDIGHQINIRYNDGSHVWGNEGDYGIELGEEGVDLSRLNSKMIEVSMANQTNYLTKEAFDNYDAYVSDPGLSNDLHISFLRKGKVRNDEYSNDFYIVIYSDGSGFAENKDNLNFILTKYKSEITEALNKTMNAFKEMTSIKE